MNEARYESRHSERWVVFFSQVVRYGFRLKPNTVLYAPTLSFSFKSKISMDGSWIHLPLYLPLIRFARHSHWVLESEAFLNFQFSSVQSLSRVRLFEIPWIIARQASWSITNSQSSLKLISFESVMPSSHLILCHALLLLRKKFRFHDIQGKK